MPKVDLSFEHGQTFENARANFEKGITQARSRFGMFIHEVDWSDDRSSARLTGKGFDLRLRLDDARVHVTGTAAIFPRFLDAPVRKFLAEIFQDGPRGTPHPRPQS